MSLRAVISGDLVASARLGAERAERAIAALRQAAPLLSAWCGADVRFTRFRGDGWQLCLAEPGLALDAVVRLTAFLRLSGTGAATRMAIGFGAVERPGTRDLSDAFGEAFTLAGAALDSLPRHGRIALANPRVVRGWHEALFALVAWMGGRWSPAQAEAVAAAQEADREGRMTQAAVADRLGVTRQAVQLRLRSAGWEALETALAAVRRHDWREPADG